MILSVEPGISGGQVCPDVGHSCAVSMRCDMSQHGQESGQFGGCWLVYVLVALTTVPSRLELAQALPKGGGD